MIRDPFGSLITSGDVDGSRPEDPPSRSFPWAGQTVMRDTWDGTAHWAFFDAGPHGTGPVQHRRSVFYRRGAYWIVVDDLRHFEPAVVEVLWNFHPDVEVTRDAHGLTAHANGHPLLSLQPLEPERWETDLVRGREHPRPDGWYAPQYNTRHPAYTARMRTRSRRPERLIWLLLPTTAEAPAGVAFSRTTQSGGTDLVRVRWSDQSEDQIRFAPDGTAEFEHLPDP